MPVTQERSVQTKRARLERGATLVEYTLLVGVLVVLCVAGIRWITSEGEEATASEADCVSTRPPPETCIAASVTTVTTTNPVSTVTTEAPTTTTDEPSPTTEPPASSTTSSTASPTPDRFQGDADLRNVDVTGRYSGSGRNRQLRGWWATMTVDIDRNGRGSNAGIQVVVRWTVTSPDNGESGTATCTTGQQGTCSIRVPPTGQEFSANWRDVRVEFLTVGGQQAPNGADTANLDRP